MKLYELTDEYAKLMEMMEEDGEDNQALQDTLEMIGLDIADKADGYGMVLKNVEAEVKAIRDEEKRLANRRRVLENNSERLKLRLKKALEFMLFVSGEKPTVKGKFFTMSLRKSEAVVIDEDVDLEKVNPKYVAVKREANKDEIKKCLKDGGFLAWAHLEERQNLSIR